MVGKQILTTKRVIVSKKSVVEIGSRRYLCELDAGMLENVLAVDGPGWNICAEGRHHTHVSREVWACSDACESSLLHGAGLDPGNAGMR